MSLDEKMIVAETIKKAADQLDNIATMLYKESLPIRGLGMLDEAKKLFDLGTAAATVADELNSILAKYKAA